MKSETIVTVVATVAALGVAWWWLNRPASGQQPTRLAYPYAGPDVPRAILV